MVDKYLTIQEVPCCCRTDILIVISTEMDCLIRYESGHFYMR